MGKSGGGGAPAQLEPPKTPAPGLPNMPGGFNYSSPYRSQNFGLFPSIAPYQEFSFADFLRPSQQGQPANFPVNSPGTSTSDMLFGISGSPSTTHPLGDDSDRRPHQELLGRTPLSKPNQELFGKTPAGQTYTMTYPSGDTMLGFVPQQRPSNGKGPFLPGGPGQNGYMRNNGFWDQMSGSLLDEAQLRNTQAADAAAAAKAEEERLKKLKEAARDNEHRNGSEK